MEICDKSGVYKFQALEFPENPIIRFEQQGGYVKDFNVKIRLQFVF